MHKSAKIPERPVERRVGLAGRAYTTGEMQGYERELIDRI
jgi:hypothetical protein